MATKKVRKKATKKKAASAADSKGDGNAENESTDTVTQKDSSKSSTRVPDYSDASNVITKIQSGDIDSIRDAITKHALSLASKHGLDSYKILVLHDERDSISSWHSNRIYTGASNGDLDKDILLVVTSTGGSIEPAYLISKTCKRLSSSRFVVAVPRKAKSAATLIALGADEIHMGLLSELGPVDPQIGGYPALGTQHALNVLAKLACSFPEASNMLATVLNKKLDLRDLGYMDRISESAVQYAERLLSGKEFPDGKTAQSLADHFVNHYKDHSFVIDVDEATELLGSDIVKRRTAEYGFANDLYTSLDIFRLVLGWEKKHELDFVGSLEGGIHTQPKRNTQR